MSRDALFQLGMGSVLLKASQKEDPFDTRATTACVETMTGGEDVHRRGLAAFAAARLFRARPTSRKSRAKAPTPKRRQSRKR